MIQHYIVDLETAPIAEVRDFLVVEPATAPANYKDPVKIAAYIKEAEATALAKSLANAALDIDLARIIALGINRPGYETEVLTTEHRTEADILGWFWDEWQRVQYDERRLVTYNGLSYDVPLLLRRSMYLGVKAPAIQIDRFKHPQVIDLFAILSRDGQQKPWHGLQWYLARLNYRKGGTDISGAEIGQAYAEGRWDLITEHCRMDVDGTKWLAERIGAVTKGVQPISEAVGF